MSEASVHETAIVSSAARIAPSVSIGPYTIVHDNVVIGEGTVIGAHCEIGHRASVRSAMPLTIGAESLIRSHSVLYEGSTLGDRLVTGHHVTIREGTVAGIGLQVGTLSDIQGDCVIGDYTRMHSNVHVGQGSTIGSFVWLFPYVVLTNDPHPPSEVRLGVTVHDYAVVATMSVLLPGVRVGEGALIGAHSSVSRDVAADSVVVGSPAKFVGAASDIAYRDGSGAKAYPWRYTFHRGYEESDVRRWLAEAERRAASSTSDT
ncbi:MAG: N-acetyltransferase [Cryobacterium sp.]|nr:N-acetyltransferase [Cryobacterium sp.]